MKKGWAAYLLWATLLFAHISLVFVLSVEAQPSVPFKIARAGWGEDPDAPIKAFPGDTGQPLTVQAQNLSPNETIKGVTATLRLQEGPFTDVYGRPNATATGEPEIGDILEPTDEILPKGFFTLTFSLDIDSNALPGNYVYSMDLSYSVNVSGAFLDGMPVTLNVGFVLSEIESSITCTVSPQIVEKGESIDVSGALSPVQSNATVNLVYKHQNGSTQSKLVSTDADGAYRDSYQAPFEGFWSVNASWGGDLKHASDSATASFEVRFAVTLEVFIPHNTLIAGLDSSLDITLLNSGAVKVSAVDATLSVPQPLITYGKTEWSFDQMEPEDSETITVEVYAPESSIGTTYRGTLDLDYRDYYGEIYTDSHVIGLIVTGKVELVLYDRSANLQTTQSGTTVSVASTLLNRGNSPARYVNATILPSSAIELTSESTVYIGEIEENAPTPFTLLAVPVPNLQNGTYSLSISITYIDDLYQEHTIEAPVSLVVDRIDKEPNGPGDTQGLAGSAYETGLVALVIIGASVGIILLYRRNRRAAREA